MTIPSQPLEADYAMSLHPVECDYLDRGLACLNKRWGWTGWKKRCWPDAVVRPGLLIYKYDLRPTKRELCVLLKLTHGGSFTFDSMHAFRQRVYNLTDLDPEKEKDDDSCSKWQEIEKRLSENVSKGKHCTGLCLRWEVVKTVSIPLPGIFPQDGWCDLRKPNYGMKLK